MASLERLRVLADTAARHKQTWLDACVTRDAELMELDAAGYSLDTLARWANLTKSGVRFIIAKESGKR